MADWVLQATLSNLLVSTVLACIAWFVQRRYQAPSLANLVWVLVLIKMLTPPIFSVPLVPVESIAEPRSVTNGGLADDLIRSEGGAFGEAVVLSIGEASSPTFKPDVAEGRMPLPPTTWTLLGLIWALGSVILLLISAGRILRFHWTLHRNAQSASETLMELAQEVAERMQLRSGWRLVVTRANLSPFVWWVGGAPRVVLPESAEESLSAADLQMVLAHEMAHIKRRDHWVRWLEWSVVLAAWWNPIMWWSRRQLRVTEEIACDALALEAFDSKRHEYASSLLNMAELLATSEIRPPAVACAMNSGGALEKRLTMIIADKKLNAPWWVRIALTTTALAVFPLGLVYAQDINAVKKRLAKAVEAEELSAKQARAMLRTLSQTASDEAASEKAANDKTASNVEKERRREQDVRGIEGNKQRFEQAARRFKAAVNEGDLSAAEAESKLKAMKKELFGEYSKAESPKRDKEPNRETETRQRRYLEFARRIEAALASGEMSADDAKEKLSAVREAMFGGERKEREANIEKDRARQMEIRERHYKQQARELEAAVEAGRVLKEDADKRLSAIRKNLFDGAREVNEATAVKNKAAELDARGRRYAQVARDIAAAVQAENISREEAERKLLAIRKELLGDLKEARELTSRLDKGSELEARKHHYMAVAEEIKAAVNAGKISGQQAEQKLQAIRQELFEEHRAKEATDRKSDDGAGEARNVEALKRRRFEGFAREIEAAVDSGKMSKEAAEKRLTAVRRDLFGGERKREYAQSTKEKDREIEARARYYKAVVEAVQSAVAAGKLSKQDGEKTLIELRVRMFDNQR